MRILDAYVEVGIMDGPESPIWGWLKGLLRDKTQAMMSILLPWAPSDTISWLYDEAIFYLDTWFGQPEPEKDDATRRLIQHIADQAGLQVTIQ